MTEDDRTIEDLRQDVKALEERVDHIAERVDENSNTLSAIDQDERERDPPSLWFPIAIIIAGLGGIVAAIIWGVSIDTITENWWVMLLLLGPILPWVAEYLEHRP